MEVRSWWQVRIAGEPEKKKNHCLHSSGLRRACCMRGSARAHLAALRRMDRLAIHQHAAGQRGALVQVLGAACQDGQQRGLSRACGGREARELQAGGRSRQAARRGGVVRRRSIQTSDPKRPRLPASLPNALPKERADPPEGPSTPTSSPLAATLLTRFRIRLAPGGSAKPTATAAVAPAASAAGAACPLPPRRPQRGSQRLPCRSGTVQDTSSKVSRCTGSVGRRRDTGAPLDVARTAAVALRRPLANRARCLRGRGGRAAPDWWVRQWLGMPWAGAGARAGARKAGRCHASPSHAAQPMEAGAAHEETSSHGVHRLAAARHARGAHRTRYRERKAARATRAITGTAAITGS